MPHLRVDTKLSILHAVYYFTKLIIHRISLKHLFGDAIYSVIWLQCFVQLIKLLVKAFPLRWNVVDVSKCCKSS